MREQSAIEILAEHLDRDTDLSDYLDRLAELGRHPVNLNKARIEDLCEVPFITENQAREILLYRQLYGAFQSIYELKAIPGLDSVTISRLIPYVAVGESRDAVPLTWKNLSQAGKTEAVFRYGQVLCPQKGYSKAGDISPSQTYAGSQQEYFLRFRYSFTDKFTLGIAGRKSPGEEFFKGSQPYGMDFYAGFAEIKNLKFLKKLVIGNFSARFGQSLTLGTGNSFSGVPALTGFVRPANGIRSSTSIDEVSYFRGIAATVGWKKFDISLFYSRHRCEEDILNGTGLHRTESEILQKNRNRETVLGGNLSYNGKFIHVGVTAYQGQWDLPVNPVLRVDNQFVFRGKENLCAGVDMNAFFPSGAVFGEFSMSRNGGRAGILGLRLYPDPGITLTVLYRDYQPRYQNLFGSAPGQNSTNSNEQGLLMSFACSRYASVSINVYADLFRFPWLKYLINNPSCGAECGAAVTIPFSSGMTGYIQYRYRKAPAAAGTGIERINPAGYYDRHTVKLQYDWLSRATVSVRSRFDMNLLLQDKIISYGYMMSVEIQYRSVNSKLNASLRFGLFDTDTWNERVYSYERGLLYDYSVATFAGTGLRANLFLGWKILKFLQIQLRSGLTWYSDREVIGTGPEQIDGNIKPDIGMQIILKSK